MTLDISTLIQSYSTVADDIATIIGLHETLFDKEDETKLPLEIKSLITAIKDYSPAKTLLEIQEAAEQLTNNLNEAKEFYKSKQEIDQSVGEIIKNIDILLTFQQQKWDTIKSEPYKYLDRYKELLNTINIAMGDAYASEDIIFSTGDACYLQLSRISSIDLSRNSKQLVDIFDNFTKCNTALNAFKEKLKKYKDAITTATAVIKAIIDLLAIAAQILPFPV